MYNILNNKYNINNFVYLFIIYFSLMQINKFFPWYFYNIKYLFTFILQFKGIMMIKIHYINKYYLHLLQILFFVYSNGIYLF